MISCVMKQLALMLMVLPIKDPLLTQEQVTIYTHEDQEEPTAIEAELLLSESDEQTQNKAPQADKAVYKYAVI